MDPDEQLLPIPYLSDPNDDASVSKIRDHVKERLRRRKEHFLTANTNAYLLDCLIEEAKRMRSSEPDQGSFEMPAASSERCESSSASVLANMSVRGGDLSRNNSNVSSKPGSTFMINVLSTFNKSVSLPQIDTWQRITKPLITAKGNVNIQIRTNGMFMRHSSGWMSRYCLVSSKGYFVIYGKENENTGHVVSLAAAKRLDISSGRDEHLDSKTKALTIKNYCSINIKWKFGTVLIQLEEADIEPWRLALINGFDGGKSLAHDLSICNRSASLRTGSNWLGALNNTTIASEEKQVGAETVTNNNGASADEKQLADESEVEEDKHLAHEQSTLTTISARDVQCGTDECTTPIAAQQNPQPKTDGNYLENDDNLNSNMWSDDDNSQTTAIPLKIKKTHSDYYASLPYSFAQRHRSDGALRIVPRGDHLGQRQPLMEWLSTVGADDRFRRAKNYFETGHFPALSEAESN